MSRRGGYTLIELMLVIVVVVMAFPALLNVFAQLGRDSARPDLHTAALDLAREKMEILAADKFNISRGYAYLVAGNYPDESPVSGFLFNRTVTFSDVSSADLSTTSAGSGYRKATVTVRWQADSASVSLSSVFTDH